MSWLWWVLLVLFGLGVGAGMVEARRKAREVARRDTHGQPPPTYRTAENTRSVLAEAPVRPEKQARIRPQEGHEWPSTGAFGFEIVGESNYQAALKRLAGDHGDSSCRAEHQAELVPESDNQHDNMAVAVKINGLLVGYFSRDDARSFRRRLAQSSLSGKTTRCQAMIVGGGVGRDGKAYSYGVRLDIKPFH